MSRETDSSSSGPQGRGGAAYPSGTPPYGARPFPSLHPQERPRPAGTPAPDGSPEPPASDGPGGQNGAQPGPDEPRTETTLTTRIRINIPGSRPIPPVVVRTPVEEGTQAPEPGPAGPAAPGVPGGAGDAGGQGADPQAAAAAPAEPEAEPEKASDWFAPRKPVAAPPPEPGPSYGDGPQTPPPPPGGAPADPFGTGTFTADDFFRPARPDSDTGSHPLGAPAPDPFGDPDTGSHPLGTPPVSDGFGDSDTGSFRLGAPGGAPAPDAFSDSDTGSGPRPFGIPDPFADSDTGSGPRPFGIPDPFADPDTGSTPGGYLPPPVGAGGPAGPGPMPGPGAGPAGRGPHDTPAAGMPTPFGTDDFPPGVPRPVDPLAGPNGHGGPRDAAAGSPFAPPAGPTTGPGTGAMQVPPFATGGPGGPGGPNAAGGPNGPVGPGGPGGPAGPSGFRPPVPGAGQARPGGPGAPGGPGGRVSGDTLVSGIPAVPPGPVIGPNGRGAPTPPQAPGGPAAPSAASAPAKAAAKKGGGRSKLVLAGVGVGAVVVLAYGAGLLMNHADVPRGTTVLGVDIGNMTKDEAVQRLNKALGDRTTAPLTLTVGGKKQTLKPSVAGLTVDTDATVRGVAHTDYNPVSVIGSLFGGGTTVAPVIQVDNDKLKAALQGIAGRNSSGSDGMVKFADHKAIAVPGKPGSSFDVNAAATQVADAYRTRAESGTDQPVALPVTTVPPKVTQAELNQAVQGFGKTAMSGQATVRADGSHKIPFNNSLPTFLTMTPDAQGKLAPHIDLAALKSLYGATFNGVLLQRADGSKTAVTPQDVATALIKALSASDPAGRVVTLPHVVK